MPHICSIDTGDRNVHHVTPATIQPVKLVQLERGSVRGNRHGELIHLVSPRVRGTRRKAGFLLCGALAERLKAAAC